MTQWDVVIVGGGLAGLRAAIALSGLKVAILSRVHPLRSHSVAAQGGINAALKNMPEAAGDSVEQHTYDTVKGSDFLADQVAAATLCQEAPRTLYDMEHWGTPFSRLADGRIAQRPFGGADVPRTCYAADRTGHHLLGTLYGQTAKHNIAVFDEFVVLRLVTAGGRVHGVVGIDLDVQGSSEVQGFFACGECACISVHGENRLGGNSLLETLVFGRLTGEAVSQFLKEGGQDVDPAPLARAKADIKAEIDRLAHGKLNAPELRDRMRGVLSDHAGVFREEKTLLSARDNLRQLAEDATNIKADSAALRFNGGLVTALELPMMIDLALIICAGALARTESRGSHCRTDYTARDDGAWLKHTVALQGPEGPQLQYSDVDISKYPPVERKY